MLGIRRRPLLLQFRRRGRLHLVIPTLPVKVFTMRVLERSFLGVLACCLLLSTVVSLSGCLQNRDTSQTPPDESSPFAADTTVETDVPFVGTPQDVVDRMLKLAEVSEEDVVYDLGSGDGRIVVTAAQKFGARGVGIEIDPQRLREARRNAKQAGVTEQVEFRQEDLFEADFSEASVVTMYLLPDVNMKLRPELLMQLDPGDRVVSHAFDMGSWEPDSTVEAGTHTLYLWTIPKQIPDTLGQE